MKYVLIFCLITLVTYAAGNKICPGCVQKRVGDDQIKISAENLRKSLKKLDAADGPHYELVKVNYATIQLASGTIEKINADLKDQQNKTKTCDVDIWSRVWLPEGISVTIACAGENKVHKTHSP